MKPADVLNALKEQLQDATGLSYIHDERVFLGVRERITIFPSILIEPSQIVEEDYAYPTERLKMTVAIYGYVEVHDPEKQFVGDDNVKGILDLENDIKLALDSDRTLGGEAMHLDIRNSVYEFVNYPVRSVTINVDILFQQVRGSR